MKTRGNLVEVTCHGPFKMNHWSQYQHHEPGSCLAVRFLIDVANQVFRLNNLEISDMAMLFALRFPNFLKHTFCSYYEET